MDVLLIMKMKKNYLCLWQQEELDLGEQVSEMKIEYEAFVKEENRIKATKIEIDQEIEKYDGIVKDQKAKMSHWKKKVGLLNYIYVLIYNCISINYCL